ncbi:unknown [Bacteroides sp. CAG:633]|nr:unknown [Bacteroides sp. CAG:633]
MEGHTMNLGFMQIKTMKIEQIDYQLQQMFRRSLHIIQIETLAFVHRKP